MHAALIAVTIDMEQLEAANAALHDNVVPMVSAMPGFVAGYWLEPSDGASTAIVIFDTEAHARAGTPAPGGAPGAPVTINSVTFHEVAAHA